MQLLPVSEYQEHEKLSSILTERRKENPKLENGTFLQDSWQHKTVSYLYFKSFYLGFNGD